MPATVPAMPDFRVQRAKPIRAEIRVPGDKSISHRAVMLAGLADGRSRVTGFLPSEDCLATVDAMRALGASIERAPDDPTSLDIEGVAMRPTEPRDAIDCGNSGTTMRLLAGILAAQPFRTRLVGDASLSRRPMKRIIDPLEAMGARIEATGDRFSPPLAVEGGVLRAIEYALPVASAQVKSAVLLAGLFTRGTTTVVEPTPTRDHTERMLRAFRVTTVREGKRISIDGGQMPAACDAFVPGDISSAAFWIVAAAAMPGSELVVRGVGLNPTRTGVLEVLRRMGAQVREEPAEGSEAGEPFGTVTVQGGTLRGTEIGGSEIPNVIDELPILAVAGAVAGGRTVIRDAAELRVKESDRIACVAAALRAMGAAVDERPDGMVIEGGAPLHGAAIASQGDHRIAMAFAIAGLFATGETVIGDTDCVNTSYPGFESVLKERLA